MILINNILSGDFFATSMTDEQIANFDDTIHRYHSDLTGAYCVEGSTIKRMIKHCSENWHIFCKVSFGENLARKE